MRNARLPRHYCNANTIVFSKAGIVLLKQPTGLYPIPTCKLEKSYEILIKTRLCTFLCPYSLCDYLKYSTAIK